MNTKTSTQPGVVTSSPEANNIDDADRIAMTSSTSLNVDDNAVFDDVIIEHFFVKTGNDISENERLFTVGEMTWAIVGSHVITLALCVALAGILCWRKARFDADDHDTSKDSYGFDVSAVTGDFDTVNRSQWRPSDGASQPVNGLVFPSKAVSSSTDPTSLNRGARDADREEWIRRLLLDYRTQQLHQRQQHPVHCRTMSSASRGVYPMPVASYQFGTPSDYVVLGGGL